ncbi:PfkB family carbohydrate kinase [Serratia ficaria]|uniref:PfkB family carbohydrate kinase n=1 Tax=Serratia ficaria TaxID=61651 RepID=UPI002183C8FE|nr:PfkB family carbohydrate kinase [Serratia ficaria]CAI2449159.1 Uncharacterized sugar kinase ydjH [Serratia ficaria]
MSEFLAIKPVLVLGGAVGEVTPTQERRIGGRAFNVARALRRLEAPVVNGMPVGNGEWGATIEAEMARLGLPVLLRHGLMDNGWRQSNGEPGEPGCETQWNKAQLAMLPLTEDTLIYLSGEQLAGENGEALREWLTRLPFDQRRLLDPGMHVGLLDEDFFAMLSDSHTLLTLNRDETARLCGAGDAIDAAQRFAAAHNLTLICRLGRDGVWICDGQSVPQHIAAYAVEEVDVVGAGDAHCAGLLAGLSAGWPLPQAVDLANRVAACVVASAGAANPPDWRQLQRRFNAA